MNQDTQNQDDKEDLQDYLSHPHHWPGTEVFLRLKDQLSVLHYSPLVDKFFWRLSDTYCFSTARIGRSDLCTQLVKEGWVLANA
jgi:hypothetical protein